MKGTYHIKTLEELRAIAHPLRIEIIKAIILAGQAMSATQLAEALGERPNKIYYHLVELEKPGLLRLERTESKGNLTEKYYGCVAEHYRVDHRLFQQGDEGIAALHQSFSTALDAVATDLDALRGQRPGDPALAYASHSHLSFRLKPNDLEEFRERLQALTREYQARDDPDAGVHVGFSYFLYPRRPAAGAPPGSRRAPAGSPADPRSARKKT
jgi:DNA-binding transcriptional ArsR family regulator